MHQLGAEVAEVGAEAVAEGLSLGLAVIREHHDVIAPGRVNGQPLERRQDPVQAVECGERLGAEHAGVMGDLVVVDVVGIDALRSLAHFLRDHRGVEIALQHVRRGAKTGECPSAMDPRQNVETFLSGRLPPLLHHLRNCPHDAPGEALRMGQEPGERAPGGR